MTQTTPAEYAANCIPEQTRRHELVADGETAEQVADALLDTYPPEDDGLDRAECRQALLDRIAQLLSNGSDLRVEEPTHWCHGCGDDTPESEAVLRGGEWYCRGCDEAPAECDADDTATYHIEASYERDGQIIDCSQAEVLGEAYGVTYASRAEAEAMAAEMQSEIGEYDLDPTTRYSVCDGPTE